MVAPSHGKELFLEACIEKLAEWSVGDDKALQDFFTTDTGLMVLGTIQLMWKQKSITSVATLPVHDPYLCAATAADAQGQIRGIMNVLDRLLELANVSFDAE
jgi:hypothetical protein